MHQIDYQAHNFTCYTLPECSSDEADNDDASQLSTHSSLTSTASTVSSIDNNIWRNEMPHKNYKKRQQRISMPTMMTMRRPEMLMNAMPPQLGTYHDPNGNGAAQWGYFLPLASNCFFSPPVQRKRYR